MNRGELVSRVSATSGLDNSTGSTELDLLQDWANDGVVDVLLETHIFIKIGDMALTSGVAEYRLDSVILAIDDGRGSTPAGIGHYQLVNLAEMIDRQSANYVSPSFRKVIAIEGDLMIVSPTPSADETLRFFYVRRPSPMTDDSHDPSQDTYGGIPIECHHAIESYMNYKAAVHDNKRLPLTPKDYFEIYRGECGLIRKRKRQKRARSLVPARIGYPNSHRLARSNSQYP